MKELNIQEAKEQINLIYSTIKSDLLLCIKYHRKWKPELVKEYFWTDNWEEIQKQLDVICKPFSYIQMVQIGSVISDLHNFYIQPTEEWLKKSEKKSRRRSIDSNETTTQEA